MNQPLQGSIVCLGIGITLGSHITQLAKNYIEQADVVFVLVSDGIVEQWICEMNEDSRSLQPFYQEGISRAISYQNMINTILSEVHKNKKVVGVFYGHPGVFACVPHLVIQQAKEHGYYALMEAGISAEDCLYADLSIDPGEFGCAQFEASQFMMFKRKIDPSAYLILWQVCIAGDTSLTKFATGIEQRKILISLLEDIYSKDHSVIIYEAPTLPIHAIRNDKIKICDLLTATLNQQSTLVIPPSEKMRANKEILKKLSALSEKKKAIHLCQFN
ncbi:MAG: hypothetical protein HRT52_22580 [Colwellia sp.]|nr:hypothetical protein [Colwellia sp.]